MFNPFQNPSAAPTMGSDPDQAVAAAGYVDPVMKQRRQQMIANMLRSRSTAQPQGSMVGRRYVSPSGAERGSAVLSQLLGGFMNRGPGGQ